MIRAFGLYVAGFVSAAVVFVTTRWRNR